MKTSKPETPETVCDWLLDQIHAFMDLNDLEPDGNSFGWMALKDCSLVTRLRLGGDIKTTNMEKLLAFMQNPVDTKGNKLKPLNIIRRSLP